jgi:hypothetical protein
MDFDKWASMVHDTNALVLTDLDGRMAKSPNSVFAVCFAHQNYVPYLSSLIMLNFGYNSKTRKSVSTPVILTILYLYYIIKTIIFFTQSISHSYA